MQVESYSAGYSDRAGGIVPVHLCSNFASAADVFLETKWIGAQMLQLQGPELDESRNQRLLLYDQRLVCLKSSYVMNSTRFCNILELCLMPRGLQDPQKCGQMQPDHHQPLESSDLLNET